VAWAVCTEEEPEIEEEGDAMRQGMAATEFRPIAPETFEHVSEEENVREARRCGTTPLPSLLGLEPLVLVEIRGNIALPSDFPRSDPQHLKSADERDHKNSVGSSIPPPKKTELY
jgi:hypothetical protein